MKNTFFPPRLFTDPGTPEARIEWATQTAERLAGREQKKANAGTISGRLIDRSTPAWMQGLALPGALGGTLEAAALERGHTSDENLTELTRRIGEADSVEALLGLADEAEAQAIEGGDEEWGRGAEHLCIAANAKATRIALETGQPLWVGTYNTSERYTAFAPLFQFLGGQNYAVGQGRVRREFNAAGHVKALERARAWYLQIRKKEIEAVKARAKKSVASLQTDLLAAVLRRDKAIYHDAQLIAWENGAHDMYGVDGGRWLYLLSVSAPVAARLAVLAHRARAGQAATPLGADVLKGQVPALLKLEGWQGQDDGYRWEGGIITGNVIQIPPGSDARLRVRLTSQRITLRGKGVKTNSALLPGLERSDYLAWACSKALGAAKRARRKK